MPLNDKTVKNAKPKDAPYKIADMEGMYLLVMPTGSKYWRYDYQIMKKRKTFALGVYGKGKVSLQEARENHRKARKLVEQGIDPVKEKKRLLAEKSKVGKTFKDVAIAWTEFKAQPDTKRCWKQSQKERVVKSLVKEIFPVIGDIPIENITIDDVESVLEPIKNRGALEVLSRALGRMEAVFRYGKVKRWCTHNPADGLKEIQPSRKVKHMEYIKRGDLPQFLRDLSNYNGDFICKSATQFVLLTHLRTKEIRGLEWAFVDVDNKVLNMTADVMKMGISQTVPLSKQALFLLESLRPVTGSSPYVFASLVKMSHPISEAGMLSVIKRMGYQSKTTIHGLRSTFSTIANEELKFRPDVVESALAHKVVDPVRAAYCHAFGGTYR